MRWSIAGIMAVCACGGSSGPDDGALLFFDALDGPPSAARLELILANADDTAITEFHQRVLPTDVIEAPARYYRQRATAGFVDGIAPLDGFVVRIAPDQEASPDGSYILFAVAYDAPDSISGIGVVTDANGEPSAIDIASGSSQTYVVKMQRMLPASLDVDIAQNEALVVNCTGFRSGIAWQPPDGPQLRLLTPEPGTTDATTRELDLDCDQAIAPDKDCDDLRADFFIGAEETCDNRDSDCDGARLELFSCTVPAGTCGGAATDGIAVCEDRIGRLGACSAAPACQCAAGSPGPCTKCILDFMGGDQNQMPCAPAVGSLGFAGCEPGSPCTIEVVPEPNQPWKAEIASGPQSFTDKLTNVVDGIQLRVKLNASGIMSPGAGASVGRVILLIDNGQTSRSVGIDLELSGAGPTTCQPVNGVSSMVCG